MVSSPCIKNPSFLIIFFLFEGLLVKTEFFKLRHVESWKEAQEMPESAEFAKWIASLVLEEEACELSNDNTDIVQMWKEKILTGMQPQID